MTHARFAGSLAAGATVAALLVCGGTAASAPASGSDRAAPASAAVPSSSTAASVLGQRPTGVVSAYTLVVPKSAARTQLQARAIIPTGSTCPRVRVVDRRHHHRQLPMTKRVPGATTHSAFASLRACQADLPVRLRRATIDGITVPSSLPHRFRRVAMLGDTGCRIDDSLVQNCSSDSAWPLAKIGVSVAHEHPDVILMTGDYYYREDPCPATHLAECGAGPAPVPGAPFADTDYGWMAEFFIPLAPMFRAAPILPMRGNHEACDRGGNGYFLFLDASDLGPAACAPHGGKTAANITPSWTFDMPVAKHRTLRTVVVDSAYGRNAEVTHWVNTQHKAYQQAYALSAKHRGRESWLLTHRPMFGIDTTEETNGKPTWSQWTAIDQTAAGQGLTDHYDLLVGSHVHVAQVVQIPGQPAQVLVGNGGSIPDSETGYPLPKYGPLLDGLGKPLSAQYPPYPNATYFWNRVKYGYVLAQPGNKAHHWDWHQRAVDGKTFAECRVSGKHMTCQG